VENQPDNPNSYVELALTLTNSRGFSKIIRFDYLAEDKFIMPLVVSPYIVGYNTHNAYLTRQAVYFASNIDCVIKLLVPSAKEGTSEEEWEQSILPSFHRMTDDCLFEYSLHNPDSRLTTRSDRISTPLFTETTTTWAELSSPTVNYLSTDGGKASLLTPIITDLVEEAFKNYSRFILSGDLDYASNGRDYRLVVDSEDSQGSPPILFHELPLTYEELKFIGSLIPLDISLYDEQGDFLSSASNQDKIREIIITTFNHRLQEWLSGPSAAKVPDWETIKVSKTYNPVLLDFYFSGLSSLSPFIEYRSYYNVIEYLFEDVTFGSRQEAINEAIKGAHPLNSILEYY